MLNGFNILFSSLNPFSTSNWSFDTPNVYSQSKKDCHLPLSVCELIRRFDKRWNSKKNNFRDLDFNIHRLKEVLKQYTTLFPAPADYRTDLGFITKHDLVAGSSICVRADLHGDLKSLLENLKKWQSENLLDENYKCMPNVHLVFLGDYMDRGSHSLQIVEILSTLCLENKGQITLIRGNHEYTSLNYMYCGVDPDFKNFLKDNENYRLLTEFYQTMPLTTYICEKTDHPQREYAQFTHGLFEITVDPAPLLDSDNTYETLAISKKQSLSERIQSIPFNAKLNDGEEISQVQDKRERKHLKQQQAVKAIKSLIKKDFRFDSAETYSLDLTEDLNPLTAFNWGDVSYTSKSVLGNLGARKWRLTPLDIKSYLRLASNQHKVKIIFRGHQHAFEHFVVNDKVLVSTLPVGMESADYRNKFTNQKDRAYVLKTSQKIKDWNKQAILRLPGHSTSTISESVSVTNSIL